MADRQRSISEAIYLHDKAVRFGKQANDAGNLLRGFLSQVVQKGKNAKADKLHKAV